MAVFALAQNAVNSSAGVIGGSLDMNLALADLQTQLMAMEWYELLGLYLESAIVNLVMQAISVCVFIVVYGRMIEIYLTVSVAPIPFSTMANRERLIYKGGQANTPNILSANGSFATV